MNYTNLGGGEAKNTPLGVLDVCGRPVNKDFVQEKLYFQIFLKTLFNEMKIMTIDSFAKKQSEIAFSNVRHLERVQSTTEVT